MGSIVGKEQTQVLEEKVNLLKAETELIYDGKHDLVEANYEKGAFSTIDFTYNDLNKTLSVGNSKGDFKGMVKDRTFKVVLIGPGKTNGIDSTPANVKSIHYSGSEVTTGL